MFLLFKTVHDALKISRVLVSDWFSNDDFVDDFKKMIKRDFKKTTDSQKVDDENAGNDWKHETIESFGWEKNDVN